MVEATGSVSSGEVLSEEQNPSLRAGAQWEAASPEPRVPGLAQSGQLGMAALTYHCWEAERSLVSGVEGHILI